MLKFVTGAIAAATLVTVAAASSPAQAEVQYPWCAVYSGKDSATNCGFVTQAQCLATVSGVGGSCVINPAGPGPVVVQHRHKKHRHHTY